MSPLYRQSASARLTCLSRCPSSLFMNNLSEILSTLILFLPSLFILKISELLLHIHSKSASFGSSMTFLRWWTGDRVCVHLPRRYLCLGIAFGQLGLSDAARYAASTRTHVCGRRSGVCSAASLHALEARLLASTQAPPQANTPSPWVRPVAFTIALHAK